MKLHSQRLQSLEEVRNFLAGALPLDFKVLSRKDAYHWIETSLCQLGYLRLGKTDKGIVKEYLEKVSGFSHAQMTRLIAQYRRTGQVRDRRGQPSNAFLRFYLPEDIALLAEVDTLHGTLSGPATRKLCERAYTLYHDLRFERLARLQWTSLQPAPQRRLSTSASPLRQDPGQLGQDRRAAPTPA